MIGAVAEPRRAARAGRRIRVAMCVEDLAALAAMLARGYARDGTYVVQGYVAAGLQRRGHDVTFVAPRGVADVECGRDPERPALVRRTWSASLGFEAVSRVSWRAQRAVGLPYLNVFSTYRLVDACLQCLPGHDVVYERNAMYSDGVGRACRRLGLPYVMFFEADQLSELDYLGRPVTGLLRWRAEQVLRTNLASAARVICVSDAARQQLLARWPVEVSKVVVCPNGVDVERFRPSPIGRERARQRLGLATEPLIAFVGSFFDWHDVPTLLEAFAAVRRQRPDARLVLVGDGPNRTAMETRAAALGIAGAACFTGLVGHAEVPDLIAAADLAVAPYPALDRDLWHSPLKLYEYFASGAAVVASRTGQIAEAVRHEENGLLVPPGEPPALSRALLRLIDDPPFRRRLGQQARHDAMRVHSWDHYLDRLEAVFLDLIT